LLTKLLSGHSEDQNGASPAEEAAAVKLLGKWRATVSKSLFNAAGKLDCK
jgi:hypothetical protein